MKTSKQTIRLLAVTVIGFGLLAVLFTQLNVVAKAAPAAELDVCATCTYTTIQTAVSAANPGDTIRVAQDTYTGMMSASELTATVVLTKDLVLLGGFNADFSQRDPETYITTIDTEDNLWGGVLIFGSQAEVDGFHIINAHGGGVTVSNSESETAVGTITHNYIAYNRIMTDTLLSTGGAGVNVANGAEVVIAYNQIVSNTIERENSYGGGIRVVGSMAEITENLIAYNLSHEEAVGGGIDLYQATAVISGNHIHHNAINGIGIYGSTAEVLSNTIAQNNGGGVDVSEANVLIEDNEILSNTAEYGGGITLNSSTHFTVTHNIIRGNQATLYNGGGIATGWEAGSIGIISYNEIVGNQSADHGGGIIIYESAEVTISHNDIQLNTTQWGGGGIHVRGGSAPVTITNNTLYTNTAEYGAAILIADTNNEMLISQNDIRFNKITGEDYQPGGIHVDNMGGMVSIINNVLAHNDNRGVKGVNYTEIEIINNTLVDNGTIAVEMHAWPNPATVPMTTTVVNNVIDSHPDCAFYGFNNAVFAVHHNDVVGHDLDDCGAIIVSQSDNINVDPMFVDAGVGNYRLQPGSPAVDSGFAGLGVPDVDIDGISRSQGGGVDMGAYEAVFNQVFLPMIIK